MAAPGTPGAFIVDRQCFCCKRSSSTPGVQWNSYSKKPGSQEKIPFGDLCAQCPMGAQSGQYGMSLSALREKCLSDSTFGPQVQQAGAVAQELNLERPRFSQQEASEASA
eukprot:532540-Pyramimonas_sp.AAC.1